MNIEGRVEAQNSTFSEYGHVAYQIQGSDVYSNMEAKTPLAGLNFSRFLDNLNSRLAKTGFMQSISVKA